MAYAIRVHRHGAPDVLEWQAVEVAAPGPGEVLVRHTAVGLNFFDVYERTGLYQAALPFTPGREAAGVVEAVGSRVRGFSGGDRVAYVSNTSGAYAELRVVAAGRLGRVPGRLEERAAGPRARERQPAL